MKRLGACKDEKITEKAFSQGLLISLLSMFVCIVALCSATYAWFSDGSASSSNNTLVAGSFELVVALEAETNARPEPILSAEAGITTCVLPAAGRYTVTLTPTQDSTVKGHCAIVVNGVSQSTEVIVSEQMANSDGFAKNAPYVFVVETTEADVTLTFLSRWGIPSAPSVSAGDILLIKPLSSPEE